MAAQSKNRSSSPPSGLEPTVPDDKAKKSGKRPWSKPTFWLHDGLTDTDSATQSHPTRGDNLSPTQLYRPIS